MKKMLLKLVVLTIVIIFSGCASPERLPIEDIEVPVLFASEISVLKSNLPPNSKEKYEAAKYLLNNVDFTFARDVNTLDKIFNANDARVDKQNAIDQMLMFYYQYKDKYIRFCFYRYGNVITKIEIFEP